MTLLCLIGNTTKKLDSIDKAKRCVYMTLSISYIEHDDKAIPTGNRGQGLMGYASQVSKTTKR
jgi:hypothetical protein